jgi:pimeloyl-ACP methyl ester carboxylesterase
MESAIETGEVRVPGATLYYKCRGRGPLLLVLQGGFGDADGSDGLAELLSDRYRVISYDRRGLSRSRADDPASVTRLEVHTDDVHHLLRELGGDPTCGGQPAFVLGVSIGAVIGLDLLARYPDQVRRVVAYEPPLVALVPEAGRERADAVQREIEDTYAREGARAGMLKFMQGLGADFGDFEPGFRPAPRSAFFEANCEQLLRYDAPAVRQFQLELSAVARHAERVVPAFGARSQEVLFAGGTGGLIKVAPALALAAALSVDVSIFQGGHGAYVTHPRAFAARLDRILSR